MLSYTFSSSVYAQLKAHSPLLQFEITMTLNTKTLGQEETGVKSWNLFHSLTRPERFLCSSGERTGIFVYMTVN